MGLGYDIKTIHKIIASTKNITGIIKIANSIEELESLIYKHNLQYKIDNSKIFITTYKFKDVAYLYKNVKIVINGYSELLTEQLYLDGINFKYDKPIVHKLNVDWNYITPILRSIDSITLEETKFAGEWNEELTLDDIIKIIKNQSYFTASEYKWLLDNKFDLYYLIENNEAIKEIF